MQQLSIKERYARIIGMIQNDISEELSDKEKKRIFLDFMWEKIRYHTRMSDYVQYEYYKKSNYARRKFIDENRREIIHKVMNKPEDCIIFNSKPLFNEKFDKYLKRDWFDVTGESFEAFCDFANKYKKFFSKPADGWFGIGSGVYEIKEDADLEGLWSELRRSKSLLEQLIVQHEELEAFNQTSVNTLRVVTVLRPNGEVKIMTADLRLGRAGKVADNFHHNGIAALVDIKTGVIYTQGIDKKHKRYNMHPDSKKQIIGFRIPKWENIKETVIEAAKVVPTVHYIGWDVALSQDGEVVIVEGNCMADPDVVQMPDGEGKWNLYEPLIEEMQKKNMGR